MKFATGAALATSVWFSTVAVNRVAAEVLMNEFEDRAVLKRLSWPLDMTWLPDNRMLVAQKKGTVQIFDPSGDDFVNEGTALDLGDRICHNGERGLGSVQQHPQFANGERWIYVYYTFKKFGNCNLNGKNGPVNRLSRFWMPPGSRKMDKSTEHVLFDTPPLAYRYHNAGKIEFGKDGMIYVTVGDGGLKEPAQNPSNLWGTMVRLKPNGDIPYDNHFANDSKGVRCNESGVAPKGSPSGSKCKEVVSIGLRNPFRMAMDPNTSKVRYFINDVGSATWEEINEGGDDVGFANYGYPEREGPCEHHRSANCDKPGQFKDPVHYYRHGNQGGAATASAFVPNNIGWPSSFDGSYLYGDHPIGKIYRMKDTGRAESRSSNPPKSNKDVIEFVTHPFISTMRFGPYKNTQALYYAAVGSTNVIRRVSYVGKGNSAPKAVIQADHWQGQVGLKVQFTAKGSSDTDNDPLTYSWDFDNDGNIDRWGYSQSWTFWNEGNNKVTLTVTDGNGGIDTTSVQIKLGSPPSAVMASPAEGATFEVGQVFKMFGYARGDSNVVIEWEIRQHHNEHWHPYLDKTTGMNNKFSPPAPDPEDYIAATNSHLEFIMTVKNSIGLSSTVSRLVKPRTVMMDFDTIPTGLELSLNGTVLDAPGTATTWEKQNLAIQIADYQSQNGNTYAFDSWSHGGAQNQTFVVPNKGASVPKLVATYTQVGSGVAQQPPPPPPPPPPAPSGNCLQVLLLAKEEVQSGSSATKAGTGAYIYQERNGRFHVRKGSESFPKELIFKSDADESDGEYFSRMQSDGNLITRSMNDFLRGGGPSDVWKTGPGPSRGDYFLALDCGEETISVYKGTPDNPGAITWTSSVGPMVPFDASALDYTGYVDSEPNTHSGDCFGGPVDATYINDATCIARGSHCAVGWTFPGEELHYKFRADEPETVKIRLRAASAYVGRKFSAWIDGVDNSGKDFFIRPNGGWDLFEDYISVVDIPAGHHTLIVHFNDGEVNLCSVTVMIVE